MLLIRLKKNVSFDMKCVVIGKERPTHTNKINFLNARYLSIQKHSALLTNKTQTMLYYALWGKALGL